MVGVLGISGIMKSSILGFGVDYNFLVVLREVGIVFLW